MFQRAFLSIGPTPGTLLLLLLLLLAAFAAAAAAAAVLLPHCYCKLATVTVTSPVQMELICGRLLLIIKA